MCVRVCVCCPWKEKEMKEFQIIHRWYNFHFSSITAEARLSLGAHRSPALRREAQARGNPAAANPARTRPQYAARGIEGGRNSAQAEARALEV